MVTSSRTGPVIQRLREQLEGEQRAWTKVRTLASLAGSKSLSGRLRTELAEAMAAAGIHHYPASLEHCRPDDALLVSWTPFRDPGLPFRSERELGDFIQRHYRRLPPFASCTSVRREEEYGAVRVDMCFRTYGGGRIVCELERGTGRFEPGSQIIRYMEAVMKSVEGRRRKTAVSGVVISGAPNPTQEALVADWCADMQQKVDWYYYRLGLELEPAPLHMHRDVTTGAPVPGS